MLNSVMDGKPLLKSAGNRPVRIGVDTGGTFTDLQIFDARKIVFHRFADVVGKIGEVSGVTESSFKVTAQGGMIDVLRARGADGKKVSGGEFAHAAGLGAGTILGT